MRVVCSAALWLQGEDPKRETGFEILAALAKLGDRDAIIAAVQALKSLSPSCRQAGVDILGHGARAQAHPLACMALAMCVADGDQDLPTSEQIAKARQLLSLSSRDISHALDVHLESVENSSPSEAEEPEEHHHTGRTQELLQHLRQHLIAEGIAKAVRVILETAVEDPEPLTGDRTTFPRLPSDIPAALNVLSARRDNCRLLRGPAEQGSLEAIAALCGSLEDDCADVREQAVDVLGGIPTQRFLLETVAKRLAHEQSHVRVAAVELLCRNSDRDGVCDVTLPYLESLNSGTRQSAIRVLASMATRSEKAMSGLRERLDDKEMEVRQEALVALCMLERSRKGVLLLSALLCGWKIAPSFLDPQVKNLVADVGRPGRRDVLGGMALLTIPDVAWAKRASSSGGDQNLPTQQSMPGEIETEESISEDWQPVDIGESTLVDPDDPKYKQMSKLAKEIEKQKAKNDEFDKMTQEEKQQKMCELLGRGCSSI
ncbi:unnamed protein product [Symbiodinium microadriaticum]|nr:unnamed protein product [Symbiodinium microadriaticum]